MVVRHYNGNMYNIRNQHHRRLMIIWIWQGNFYGFGVKRKVWHR